MESEIVNRVALSPLQTFDLAEYYTPGERVVLDIRDQLFMGQIVREKDFRAWVDGTDWSAWQGKHVLVTCSADAIIPAWTWMLLAVALQPFAATVVKGSSLEDLENHLFRLALDKVDFSQYAGKKMVVKGCGDIDIPAAVYLDLTARLRPWADKIMYGEPCSTVPIFKKAKT